MPGGNDVDVVRLMQDLDEGIFEYKGAPHAKTDISGNWLEGYRLFYGDTELECGHKFSYYGIPYNATITAVIVSEPNKAEHSRCYIAPIRDYNSDDLLI